MYPLSDLTLARRLERTEACANASFVEARAALDPASGAVWMEVGGTYAMFDGRESPLTQTFGLGLFADLEPRDLERLEAFFRERDAPVNHEVSPLSGVPLVRELADRGYRVAEQTSVMYQPIDLDALSPPSPAIDVRPIHADQADEWAATAATGWSSESPALEAFMRGLGRISVRAEGTTAFLAWLEGRPIAAAALRCTDGVALLAGASTVPAARKQGAQQALLHARLHAARANGCDLAMMCAAPGGPSQRNAERQGFRIAYTRTKWELKELKELT